MMNIYDYFKSYNEWIYYNFYEIIYFLNFQNYKFQNRDTIFVLLKKYNLVLCYFIIKCLINNITTKKK